MQCDNINIVNTQSHTHFLGGGSIGFLAVDQAVQQLV